MFFATRTLYELCANLRNNIETIAVSPPFLLQVRVFYEPARLFVVSIIIIIEVLEVLIPSEHCRFDEVVEGSPVFFSGASRAALPVNKSADAAHLQQFVLFRVGDVLIYLRNEFGSDALLDAREHLEGVGDGRFRRS